MLAEWTPAACSITGKEVRLSGGTFSKTDFEGGLWYAMGPWGKA